MCAEEWSHFGQRGVFWGGLSWLGCKTRWSPEAPGFSEMRGAPRREARAFRARASHPRPCSEPTVVPELGAPSRKPEAEAEQRTEGGRGLIKRTYSFEHHTS